MEEPQTSCRGGAQSILNVLPNSSVSIRYDSLFGPHDDLILLELDEKLLPDILHESFSCRVTLRGCPDEDAVLCTPSKTYAVKFVGNSNSVYLIPPADQSALLENLQGCNEKEKVLTAPVIKMAHGNMELIEVAPRLDNLKLLLSENPYSFDEVSGMEGLDGIETEHKGLYRWNDLIERIQASDEELRSGLQALSAVEIEGYWRLVDEKYMDGILNMLLHNSVLNEWSLNALNEDEVVNVLESDGFPRKIAQHCLLVYGSKVDEGVNGRGLWTLDELRVCIHFARQILRGKMKMESFMEEWTRKVPEAMQVSFEMLEGEVLTDKVGVETWVYPFSVHSLPSTPADRFSILFRERSRWEWKDLQPYIRDLRVPGLSSEALLLKYTRKIQPTSDVEPIFSSR